MASSLFITLFTIFNITYNNFGFIHASSFSPSSSAPPTSSSRAARNLNSKIASLIKQSSMIINSYGRTSGGSGRAATATLDGCNPDNIRNILSRIQCGGASTISASGGAGSNTTASVLKSQHGYGDIVQSSVRSGSSNSAVVLTASVSSSSSSSSSSTTDSSSNGEGLLDNAVALEDMDQESVQLNDATNTEEKPIEEEKKLKVLFLSADTGGGHRASAQSLASQFLKHYPGIEYELLDVWTPTNIYPYKTLVKSYKHLSAHPRQWRLLYYISNMKWYEILTDTHSHKMCRDKIEKQIEETNPDIVISVHPTMNYVPERAVRHIGEKKGKYIPFFTVVTDFGSAHCTWFQKNVDMIYVASKRILKLAKRRGNLNDDKIVMSGLPIREDFAIQAENMGDRTTVQGKEYRKNMKSSLGIDPNKKTILLMGGGEGVGSLSKIAGALRRQLVDQGVDATILVVCGRNEKLQNELNEKDWDVEEMKLNEKKRSKRRKKDHNVKSAKKGDVEVVGLGFITNMADYMVAADVLVSKAGPGTIAEAAALGLPVMITSFLPGQEAGNVNIVLDGGFGAFHKRSRKIASTISEWLQDEFKLDNMSRNSMKVGNPTAASDIVQDIYKISMDKIMNGEGISSLQ